LITGTIVYIYAIEPIYNPMKNLSFPVVSIFLIFFTLLSNAQVKGYYRFPTLYDHLVVFTAEGDLWQYNESSGISIRLTTSHGMESNASISPDGKWIAFNAEYEGPAEVYTLQVTGGIPKRITFEGIKGGSAPRLYGWTQAGKLIISSSSNTLLPGKQLILTDPLTLENQRIPLSQADEGVFDESGNLYFTRFAFQGSHTKRYKGGTAQSLWKFDGSHEAVPLTADYSGTSKNPMFYQGRLYFLSDRDGTMNIWSMNPDGTGLQQHTQSVAWDLKDAECQNGRIIYQKQADLWIFDIATGKEKLLDISLVSDFDQNRPFWEKDPVKTLQAVSISHSGEYVSLTSRGRVFTAPVSGGRWAEITREYGIRFKSAKFLGKNEEVVFLSDKSGEMELWKAHKNGLTVPEQLTLGSKVLIMDYLPSPDGKYIVYTEKDYAMKLYDTQKKSVQLIDQDNVGGFDDLSWSSDGKWLAYVDPAVNQCAQIKVRNIASGAGFYLTSDRLESYNPVFSADGKWLYFISDRTFNTSVGSPWGPRQPEPFYQKTAKMYMLALYDSLRSPFLSYDELNPKPGKKEEMKDTLKSEVKSKTKSVKEIKTEKIADMAGAPSRLYEIPVSADNISSLQVNDKFIYWIQTDISDRQNRKLQALEISNKINNKPVEITDNVTGFEISGNGKKILIRKSDGMYVTDADGKKADLKDSKISLKDWIFKVDPVEDRRQMLVDAWRLERDYFYDKNLHGVDWKAVLDRHLPLIGRTSDRFELDDLLISMVSELSALHTFVYGGEKRESPDDIAPASLGARLVKNAMKGGYVIEHIYNGDPDLPEQRSPLGQPQVSIKEGDVITKINGVDVLTVEHINRLMDKKEGQEVRLMLKDAKGMEYEQIVKPVSMAADASLRYSEWEYTRRLEVEKQSDNRIGYFHLRAMSGDNFQEFVKGYYPVFNREGLIMDVRNNRGGNIDSWVLNRLIRKAWFYWQSRAGSPYWNMQYAFRGHIVVLCNESTASDGEAFAEGIKRLDLGKVIGTRTWGGEIWLSSGNRLVDNGIATASEMGVYTEDGQWIIEGHGVDPDMTVDNLPYSTYQGKDAQLEAAIQFLQKKIKEEPVVIPPFPALPDKSFNYPGGK
jgi:tricorn protease